MGFQRPTILLDQAGVCDTVTANPTCGVTGAEYEAWLRMPSVIVDASWQDKHAGAGLVLSMPDKPPKTRAYSFTATTSTMAEAHGIKLALEWLMDLAVGRGVVLCDCVSAVKKHPKIPQAWLDAHEVRFLPKNGRDLRHQRAHQISVVAREMGQRLASQPSGPIPVPWALSESPDPPRIVAEHVPRAPTVQWPRATVVLDDIADMHAYAMVMAGIPSGVIPVVYGTSVGNGQAMFGTKISIEAANELAGLFDRMGVTASIYVSDP